MNQSSSIENILMLVSGLLLAAGAGCYAFLLLRPLAAVCFLAGAVGFCFIQQRQIVALRRDGGLTLRRLCTIMTFAHVLFLLSGLLMIEEQYQPIGRWLAERDMTGGSRYISFVTLVYGKWVVMLLIASVLELYTTQRISAETKGKE